MNRRVGYRFHPTDEELIDYFLRSKINGTLLNDGDVLLIDICKFDPWELPKYAAQGPNEDVWYFFHKRELKNKNSSKPRYNRSTKTGHWKPTGKVRPVKAKRSRAEIGVKKTLVFYKYAESNKELRTNWVIHEYEPKSFPSHQADLVLCKLKEKADDKAESSTCSDAELTRRGPLDSDVLPAELSSSEMDPQQLPRTIFPRNGVNFDELYTSQPQIQIDEGVSIDDLGLPDDIFRSASDGFMYQFETNDQQPDPNEMDISFSDSDSDGFMYQFETNDQQPDPNEMDISFSDIFSANTTGYNLQETASNAHTTPNHSSSGQPHNGIYLVEIADMDSNDLHGMFSQLGDQTLNSGYSGSREYRQMRSVQSLTETLPAPIIELQACVQSKHLPSSRYERSGATTSLVRHEKISSTGTASKGSPVLMEAHTRSGNKNMAAGNCQIQVKFSRPSELKAREARKCGTGLNLPRDSPKEKITAKTILMPTSRSDKTCSSINTQTSILYQRSAPLSVYIVNVSIGLVLFVTAFSHLLILH
ncbi:NAC domain containing protein 35 [Euphorbia peplus]|nr:NAC domain containing protein 35 [Euphorbia peplus]